MHLTILYILYVAQNNYSSRRMAQASLDNYDLNTKYRAENGSHTADKDFFSSHPNSGDWSSKTTPLSNSCLIT